MDLIMLLRKKLGVILVVALIAGLVAFVISSIIPKTYEARVRLLVKGGSSGFSLSDPMLALIGSAGLSNDYAEILKGWTILHETAKQLGLPSEPNSKEFGKMKKALKIEPVIGTNVVEIQFRAKDPKEAMDVANGLATNLEKRAVTGEQGDALESLQIVQSQLATERAKLATLESEINTLQKNEKIYLPNESTRAVLNRLAQIDSQIASANVAMVEGKASLQKINNDLTEQEKTVVSSQVVTNNPIYTSLQQKLIQQQIELSTLLQQFTDAHPSVVAIRHGIEATQAELQEMTVQIVNSQTVINNPVRQSMITQAIAIQNELTATEAGLKALEEYAAGLERNLSTLPNTELDLSRLLRRKTSSEQISVLLEQKEAELKISSTLGKGDVQIIDHAYLPIIPATPRRLLNTAIALVAGFFIGLGVAAIGEKRIQDGSTSTARSI